MNVQDMADAGARGLIPGGIHITGVRHPSTAARAAVTIVGDVHAVSAITIGTA